MRRLLALVIAAALLAGAGLVAACPRRLVRGRHDDCNHRRHHDRRHDDPCDRAGPAPPEEEDETSSTDWVLIAIEGLLDRVHRPRRPCRRHRPRPVRRCRHRDPRLRLRAHAGRAARRCDVDHRRGDLGRGGDAGRGRRGLHGPRRQQALRTTEVDQLRRRSSRTCSASSRGRATPSLIIPVINEVSYANKIRPERPLASSTVASAFGITSSPVAAAMATILPLVEVYDYELVDVLLDHDPGEHHRHPGDVVRDEPARPDLEDDAEYQRRLAAGEVTPPAAAADIVIMKYAKRSVAIFLGAVALICTSASPRTCGRRFRPRAAASSRSR